MMAFVATWMDRDGDDHTKWSKPDRDWQVLYSLYVESKTWHKGTYLQNRIRPTDINNRHVVAKRAGELWIGSLGLAGGSYYV